MNLARYGERLLGPRPHVEDQEECLRHVKVSPYVVNSLYVREYVIYDTPQSMRSQWKLHTWERIRPAIPPHRLGSVAGGPVALKSRHVPTPKCVITVACMTSNPRNTTGRDFACSGAGGWPQSPEMSSPFESSP